MFKILFRWIKGNLRISTTIQQSEKLINMCRHHGVFLWNISCSDKNMTFYMSVSDFIKAMPIFKKIHIHPHIEKRIGLPFIIYNILKRGSLLPCFIISMITLFAFSCFVWNINVSGQQKNTKEDIIRFLNSSGINRLMFTGNVDGNNIEKMIRNHYDNISWVSVELKGCNMYIKLIEAESMKSASVNDNDFSDIIASEDGEIEKIITRRGTPLVKIGDKVEKGQILVSGIIEYKNDGGEIYKKEPVHADADVILKADTTYNDTFDMIHEIKQYSGRKKKILKFTINDMIYFLENALNKLESYKNYDIINKYEYFDDFCISFSVIREYDFVNVKYSFDEAKKLASEKLLYYIKRLSDNNIVINDKKINMDIGDDRCCVTGRFNLSIPQTDRKVISEQEWRVEDFNEQKRNSN